MFFWLNNPGLIIWNWRTGQQVVVCHPLFPIALTHLTSHLEQFRTGFDLPESTFDFAFISSRAFMITTTHGHGAIELYTFDAHLPPSIEALSLDGRPTHIVSLSFPEVLPGVTMRSFSTHSAPFLGGTSGQLKPFLTSQDDRIHLLSLNYGEVRRRFHLYLKNKFLLSLIPVGVGSSSQWPTKILSWEEWGPRHTRIHEHRNQFQWLRHVYCILSCIVMFSTNINFLQICTRTSGRPPTSPCLPRIQRPTPSKRTRLQRAPKAPRRPGDL